MHYFKDYGGEIEQLILEPCDWSEEEWKTLVKLFGMTEAERIVISNYTLEAYGTPTVAEKRAMMPIRGLPGKCYFCEHNKGPLAEVPAQCESCEFYGNFQVKEHMTPKQKYQYKQWYQRGGK